MGSPAANGGEYWVKTVVGKWRDAQFYLDVNQFLIDLRIHKVYIRQHKEEWNQHPWFEKLWEAIKGSCNRIFDWLSDVYAEVIAEKDKRVMLINKKRYLCGVADQRQKTYVFNLIQSELDVVWDLRRFLLKCHSEHFKTSPSSSENDTSMFDEFGELLGELTKRLGDHESDLNEVLRQLRGKHDFDAKDLAVYYIKSEGPLQIDVVQISEDLTQRQNPNPGLTLVHKFLNVHRSNA